MLYNVERITTLGRRFFPFVVEPGDDLTLDLSFHCFRVIYNNGNVRYFSNIGNAEKDLRDFGGGCIEITCGGSARISAG